ncbi:MAG: hypothetical protein Sapg2KO_08080 [Saprospiraceae bacterium]
MRILFTILVSILFFSKLLGQDKYEKEYRISIDAVPSAALSYVQKFDFDKKVKWYREESLSLSSIEAKTKWNKQRYSIEFDTTGLLQDIEITINFEAISIPAQQAICEALTNEFDRYKLKKIQRQYSGNKTFILAYLSQEEKILNPEVKIQFEIVLEGKTEASVNLYEYTFSQQGKLINKRRIVLRNTDILEY